MARIGDGIEGNEYACVIVSLGFRSGSRQVKGPWRNDVECLVAKTVEPRVLAWRFGQSPREAAKETRESRGWRERARREGGWGEPPTSLGRSTPSCAVARAKHLATPLGRL